MMQGERTSTARPYRHGLPVALAMATLGTLVFALAVDAPAASGVGAHPPTEASSGAFVFGRAPVRPEVTRQEVATQNDGASPLALLFRVVRGIPATPTHVISPPSSTEPAAAPTPAAPTPAAPTATPQAVVPAPAPFSGAVPPFGKAWAWGCAAAVAYLNAYAAPGFTISCPGNAGGHQAATTCISGYSLCSDGRSIVIADPCPAAYMNEASNSWVLLGLLDAPIDPYGSCPD
jgi:hypothetical protein